MPTPGKKRKRKMVSFAQEEVVGTQQSVNQQAATGLQVVCKKAPPSRADKGKAKVADPDTESSYSSDSSLESDRSEEGIDPNDVYEGDSEAEELFPLQASVQEDIAAMNKAKKPKKEYALKTKAAKERVTRYQQKVAAGALQDQFLSDVDSDDNKELEHPSDDDDAQSIDHQLPKKRKSRAKKRMPRVWYDENKPKPHTQFVQLMCFKDEELSHTTFQRL